MKTIPHYEINSRKQFAVWLFVLALFGMICIADKPVQADSIPIYDIAGTLTIMGNNVCGLSPCTETINFSFDYTYTFNGFDYLGEIVGTPIVSSYGALGSSFGGLTGPHSPFHFANPTLITCLCTIPAVTKSTCMRVATINLLPSLLLLELTSGVAPPRPAEMTSCHLDPGASPVMGPLVEPWKLLEPFKRLSWRLRKGEPLGCTLHVPLAPIGLAIRRSRNEYKNTILDD